MKNTAISPNSWVVKLMHYLPVPLALCFGLYATMLHTVAAVEASGSVNGSLMGGTLVLGICIGFTVVFASGILVPVFLAFVLALIHTAVTHEPGMPIVSRLEASSDIILGDSQTAVANFLIPTG